MTMQAHSKSVISCLFSPDSMYACALTPNAAKFWYWEDLSCFRSIQAPNNSEFTACTFCESNEIFLADKSGQVYLYNVETSELLNKMEAHAAEIKCINYIEKDQSSYLVTGAMDSTIKIWAVPLENNTKFELIKSFEFDEKVIYFSISPDKRNIIVSLLDNTLKVLDFNKFKIRLNLYGHKLPVLSSDVSSDSKILATGSMDKDIKFWGLNFGDCHFSRFAHGDGVMCVKFKPNSNICFSAGKDGMIKAWDSSNASFMMQISGII